MTDFMLIFVNGDYSKLSPEEMQANMQNWFGWVNDLKEKGIYVSGEALTHGTGKIIKGKDAVVTDGPFAESKEVVGGFFIVKAESIDEAAEIGKSSPDLPYGGAVLVREVMKF